MYTREVREAEEAEGRGRVWKKGRIRENTIPDNQGDRKQLDTK